MRVGTYLLSASHSYCPLLPLRPLMLIRLSLLEDAEEFPQIMQGLANTLPTITMDHIEMANASTLSVPERAVKAPKIQVCEAQVSSSTLESSMPFCSSLPHSSPFSAVCGR